MIEPPACSPTEFVDELGAVWRRQPDKIVPPNMPSCRLVQPSGRDQTGLEWLPAPIPPELRFMPMTAAEMVAMWRTYEVEAARPRLAGDCVGSARASERGGHFLGTARTIEAALGQMADASPHYGPGGHA